MEGAKAPSFCTWSRFFLSSLCGMMDEQDQLDNQRFGVKEYARS
ncbi:hypothetical protein EDO6_01142 [Paenibacillus xylanexedens]|nr:hypothetical protein EDO6_01142 [Paenibacillus xylanexedens]